MIITPGGSLIDVPAARGPRAADACDREEVDSHPFQPLDAVLGAVLVAVGVLVAMFGFEGVDDNVFVWVAIGAVLAGIALIPWPRPRGRRARAIPDESSPDG